MSNAIFACMHGDFDRSFYLLMYALTAAWCVFVALLVVNPVLMFKMHGGRSATLLNAAFLLSYLGLAIALYTEALGHDLNTCAVFAIFGVPAMAMLHFVGLFAVYRARRRAARKHESIGT